MGIKYYSQGGIVMNSIYIKPKILSIAFLIFLVSCFGKENLFLDMLSGDIESLAYAGSIVFLLYLFVSLYIKDVKKLESISFTDSLTEVYNRHRFLELAHDELDKHIRSEAPLSFVMIDLDNFKKVNDDYGHNVGDRVLKDISSLISRNIRKTDTFARWGGEEFILMLPDSDSYSAYKISERLRLLVENHIFKDAGNLTVSIGISELTECHSLIGTIAQVDKALYKSKLDGRNKVSVSPKTLCGECETCTYIDVI